MQCDSTEVLIRLYDGIAGVISRMASYFILNDTIAGNTSNISKMIGYPRE